MGYFFTSGTIFFSKHSCSDKRELLKRTEYETNIYLGYFTTGSIYFLCTSAGNRIKRLKRIYIFSHASQPARLQMIQIHVGTCLGYLNKSKNNDCVKLCPSRGDIVVKKGCKKLG